LTELPTGQAAPRDTAYNGYDALSDGTIVAKTVFRQAGCEEQGFSAFLDCPDAHDTPPSVIVAIDPATHEVLAQLELPEMMGGRVTTSTHEGTDYIYRRARRTCTATRTWTGSSRLTARGVRSRTSWTARRPDRRWRSWATTS
jgi:hypothetical protein